MRLVYAATGLLAAAGCSPDLARFEVEADAFVRDGGLDGAQADGPTADAPLPGRRSSLDAAGGEAGADTGTLDAGETVPEDFECTEVWASEERSDPRCEARQTHVLAVSQLDVDEVSIARTGSGRVAVGFNSYDFADQGSLHFRFFEDTAPQDATAESVEGGLGEIHGVASAIRAGPRDALHVAYWSSRDFDGEVTYRRKDPAAPLTDPEVVSSGLGRRGDVDVLVDATGAVHLVHHDRDSGEYAYLRRDVREGWGPAQSIADDGDSSAQHAGELALAGDGEDTLHLAVRFGRSLSSTLPRYTRRVGDSWSPLLTIDNNRSERVSGVAIDLGVVGPRRIAAYLDWVDGVGEVRINEWVSLDSPSEITPVVSGIALQDPPPTYPLALDVDRWGLLHLVAGAPGPSGLELHYYRQVPDGDGLRWLRDVVDDEIAGTSQLPRVDLTVDEARRPHIAYLDASTLSLVYARAGP